MLNSQLINDLSNKINQIINSSPLPDMEKNINALIRGALTKMELVPRDEFEVQSEILKNACEELVRLEAKLAELEAALKKKQ